MKLIFDEVHVGPAGSTPADLAARTPVPGVAGIFGWSSITNRIALELTEAEWRLRTAAEKYGADGDAAVARAKERARTTVASTTRAMDDEMRRLGEEWLAAADVREAVRRAMQRLGIQLSPWQQQVAEAALDPRRPVITYPKQNGRGAISRVVAKALNGDPMPSSPALVITLEPAVATFWDHLEHLARESRFDPKGRRHRRVKVEQRRIRQAMRHIERRAARRQRRAASLAARGGAR